MVNLIYQGEDVVCFERYKIYDPTIHSTFLILILSNLLIIYLYSFICDHHLKKDLNLDEVKTDILISFES